MKKFIAVFITIALIVAMMTGCGNMAIGPGNYTFEKVHVDTHHYSGCFTIKEWHNNDSGIEVLTKEAGSMFLSEGTYVLISGDQGCPFCDKGE